MDHQQILPQILKTLFIRSQSAPVAMYLQNLLGSGGTMRTLPPDLTIALQNADFGNPIDAAFNANFFGDPAASPHNLSAYEIDKGNPADEGLRLAEMANPYHSLLLQRTLGNFKATPVGRDSVRIQDRYDFEGDPTGPTGGAAWASTTPFIGLAQLIGHPYEIDATIPAPKLNSHLRAREQAFSAIKESAQAELRAIAKSFK